jgi:hypothetical protein
MNTDVMNVTTAGIPTKENDIKNGKTKNRLNTCMNITLLRIHG